MLRFASSLFAMASQVMEVVLGTGMARCNSAGAQPLSPCSALSARNVALPGSHRQLLGRGSSALTAAGLGALSVAARGNGTKRGPVVCRSEVRPLADSTSDGNVMEFQSGGYHASPRLLSSPLLSRRLLLSFPSQTRTNVVAPPQ